MSWEIPRGAVIATHNRPAELRRCVEALAPQVDTLVVIDNASDPPVAYTDFDGLSRVPDCLIYDPQQPPNLSRLWNVGIDRVRRVLSPNVEAWDVAVVNDDAVPPPGWFDAVSKAMRATTAVAGCNDPFDRFGLGEAYLIGPEPPPSVMTRLAGWAFILRGEWEGARLDESMRWNFSDDDISLRARRAGGIVYIGGLQPLNTLADSTTNGLLAEQSGRDRATFVAKHGVQPW